MNEEQQENSTTQKKNHESLMEQVISRRSTLYTVQRYTEHQNSGHPGVRAFQKTKTKNQTGKNFI